MKCQKKMVALTEPQRITPEQFKYFSCYCDIIKCASVLSFIKINKHKKQNQMDK